MLQALATLGQRLLHSPITEAPARPVARDGEPVLLGVRNVPSAAAPPACDLQPPQRIVQVADPLAAYAVPVGQGRVLMRLLQEHRKALDPDFAMPLEAYQQRALMDFFARRTQLLETALPAAAAAPPSPPGGTAWPDLSGCRDPQPLLERLLRLGTGLVIGESHAARASKRLLIEHLPALRRFGVDTLYMEHLQEIHQPDLDQLRRTGVMPVELGRFLAEQDRGHMTDVAGEASFTAVVRAAQQAGLRMVALDLMTSYHLRGAATADGPCRDDPTATRIKVFNEVATQRIQHDQRMHPAGARPGRWIALMGNGHSGSYNGITGVAARLGVPSLRMEDTRAGNGERMRVGFDPGRSVEGASLSAGGDIQSDYLLKMPQRKGILLAATPEPCSAIQAQAARQLRIAVAGCARDLTRIGTFRLVTVGPGAPVLVHRSNTRSLVAQPVVPTGRGGVRLQLATESQPARWSHVDREFPDLASLRHALAQRMEEVPAAVPS